MDVFSVRSYPRLYNENISCSELTRVEAGSNTSTVTLRVVVGDEKGSLKSETVSDPRKTALAKASSIYRRQTRPLVREDAPEKQDRNCQRVINILGARHQDTKTPRLMTLT
jgi:hypothetical protein